MTRLLCLLSGMNAGGAETFLMKIYRQIDKSQYQFDFCINVPEKCFYEDEITSMGGKIYRIPSKSENVREFKRQLTQIIRDNHYTHVLRVTSNAMGFMEMKIAKQAGAKVCAVRSSNSSNGGSIKTVVAHRLGRLLYGRYVDVKIAPSDLAAEYTFGSSYSKGEVLLLKNGLDLNQYRFSQTEREKIRAEFGICENQLVFCNVARFAPQKNHKFLLRIFKSILEKSPGSKLMLVSTGPLEEEVRQQARELGIYEQVIFAGVRSDIPSILSAADVMIMPSFYEGMPNAVVEAQTTGLPCLISDTITKAADITGLVSFLPLSASSNDWAAKAIGMYSPIRQNTAVLCAEAGYSIDDVVENFVNAVFKKQ